MTKILKKQIETFNIKSINFPVTLKEIEKFKKLNNLNINIIWCEKIRKKMELYKPCPNPDFDLLYIKDW